MRIDLGVLADYANIQPDGKLNIIGIFDEFWTTAFPLNVPLLFIVYSLAGKLEEFEIDLHPRIELIDNEHRISLALEGQVQLDPRRVEQLRGRESVTVNQVVGLGPMQLHAPGVYSVRIIIGNLKKTLRLRVTEGTVPAILSGGRPDA